MAAEGVAIVCVFDQGCFVQEALEEMLGRRVKMEPLVDRRTHFHVFLEESSSLEKNQVGNRGQRFAR